MSKITYVVDTNVFLSDTDVNVIKKYGDNDIIVSFDVLRELDNHKTKMDVTGINARSIIRYLDTLREGKIWEGVEIPGYKGKLSIKKIDSPTTDEGLIAIARMEENAVIVTNDLNVRIKAAYFGIKSEEYVASTAVNNSTDLYLGYRTITATEQVIDDFHDGEDVFLDRDEIVNLMPNEFVILVSDISAKKSAVARFRDYSEPLERFDTKFKNLSKLIKPRNKEQSFALNLLMDPTVPIVTLLGKAGTGKTLLAVVAALSQTDVMKTSSKSKRSPSAASVYKKILISRPIKAMGEDIGFLPGPQSLDSKLLTPNGWTTMREIKVGDLVIARDGTPSKVLNIFPKGVKGVYKVTTDDNCSTECCEDHLWLTQIKEERKRKKEGKLRNTKEIIDSIHKMHGLPRNESVLFEEKKVPIPPYTLGALLGDGCLVETMCIYNTDEELLQKVNEELSCLEAELHHVDGTIGHHIAGSNFLKEEIHKLGLLGKKAYDKFVPNMYKYNSIDVRLELLRGLMDTDGTIKKSGEASFTTTSIKLADDVCEIVRSLGGRAQVRSRNTINKESFIEGRKIVSKRISYEFTISLPEKYNPFYISRKNKYHKCAYIHDSKIANIEYVGEKETQCILIDNPEHLYITDDFIVTHNTKEEKLTPWIQPVLDNLEYVLGDQSEVENLLSTGIIEVEAPTYIRGRSIPDTFIIIDEVQNITKHELKTIMTRVGEGSKIVLTGDIEQIDNRFLNELTNGLSHAVEVFKPYDISGHVTLTKGERSEVATLASKIL